MHVFVCVCGPGGHVKNVNYVEYNLSARPRTLSFEHVIQLSSSSVNLFALLETRQHTIMVVSLSTLRAFFGTIVNLLYTRYHSHFNVLL